MIKDEITDENLQAHADKFGAIFADGQCSIDVIPFQARDPKTGAWQPDGMAKAKERADAVFGADGETVTPLRFVRFRPPRLERTAEGATLSLPHIRLDRALQFLIGDYLA